jgi:hypothetical protein
MSKNIVETEFDYEKYKNDPRILDRFTSWYLHSARELKALPIKMFFDNVVFFNKGGVGDDEGSSGNTSYAGVSAITLYRQEQLQVQLVLVPANFLVPEHTHPNVDSYETFIGGPIYLEKNGKPIIPRESIFALEDGTCSVFLRCSKVPSSMPHGGPVGDSPAAFLTIQHWKNGVKPTSVHEDWAEDGAETAAAKAKWEKEQIKTV